MSDGSASHFSSAEERQPLEQMHVLLVLQQRAVQRRDQLARVALPEHFRRHVLVEQQLQPVQQLRGRRLLLQARHLAHLEEDPQGFFHQALLDAGEMHVDDPVHGVDVGKLDVVEEAAAQERVRQFLLVVRGDHHDRAQLGLDVLAGLVDEELHAIEFEQEIVGKFDVGLVDFVDQQHRALLVGEGFPQFAALDVVRDVGNPGVAELAVAQARHRVVFVEALLRLGGGLDVPGQKRRAERLGHFLGQHGLAGAGLALDQQRALEHDRGVDGDLEVIGGDVVFGAGKFHRVFALLLVLERRRAPCLNGKPPPVAALREIEERLSNASDQREDDENDQWRRPWRRRIEPMRAGGKSRHAVAAAASLRPARR